MNPYVRFLSIIAMLCFFCACSIRGMVINEVAKIAEDGISAFESDEDLVLMEKAFPANIKLFETMLESRPENHKMLTLLSRLYGSYAFAFIEPRFIALKLGVNKPYQNGMNAHSETLPTIDSLKQELDRYYLRGAEYALRALEVHHSNCRENIKNVSTANTFFKSLTKKDVSALFWYGFNLGEYVNLNLNSVKAISKAHLAEKAMLRVVELDPEYFHGSAHLFLMAYYGSRSPMMGGNPDAALTNYHDLLDISGKNFLLAEVFHARYLLVQQQEKKKFIRILNRIVKKPTEEKSFALLNRVAVDLAGIYLRAVDQFF